MCTHSSVPGASRCKYLQRRGNDYDRTQFDANQSIPFPTLRHVFNDKVSLIIWTKVITQRFDQPLKANDIPTGRSIVILETLWRKNGSSVHKHLEYLRYVCGIRSALINREGVRIEPLPYCLYYTLPLQLSFLLLRYSIISGSAGSSKMLECCHSCCVVLDPIDCIVRVRLQRAVP